jgi:hypothetical protein
MLNRFLLFCSCCSLQANPFRLGAAEIPLCTTELTELARFPSPHFLHIIDSTVSSGVYIEALSHYDYLNLD